MTSISEKDGGVTLKACKSCWLVKYCNAKCQKNHEALTKIGMEQYYPCCGKSICNGCSPSFAMSGNNEKCQFYTYSEVHFTLRNYNLSHVENAYECMDEVENARLFPDTR